MNNEKTKLSFDLKKIKENENIEFKKADNNLPILCGKPIQHFVILQVELLF
ncbi:hypothetical protein [Fusobacterium polymorphum]|uniref:hypothetical protein n=1 Tax=Fusobacterium nucleatum subsp. polymorphum TaxID=76857 RepID=UPI00300B7209